jgi:hypothetical protein
MSSQSISQIMRRRFVPHFVCLTLVWVVVLNVADLLPKVGEMLPRDGAWRPATQADRIKSFLWFTFCWYFGALVTFGLIWGVAEVLYDMAFGSEGRE